MSYCEFEDNCWGKGWCVGCIFHNLTCECKHQCTNEYNEDSWDICTNK